MPQLACPTYREDTVLIVVVGQCYQENPGFVEAQARYSIEDYYATRGRYRPAKVPEILFVYSNGLSHTTYGNGDDGKLSDIYELGCEVVRQGWKRFIIFDTATYRQIEWAIGKNNDPKLKMWMPLLLSLHRRGTEKMDESLAAPEFHVQCWYWPDCFESCRKHGISRHRVLGGRDRLDGCRWTPDWVSPSRLFREGQVLRDPWAVPLGKNRPMSIDLTQQLGRFAARSSVLPIVFDCLSDATPALPTEVVLQIMEYIEHAPLQFMTKFKAESGWMKLKDRTLPVISLIPLSQLEIQQAEEFFRKELTEIRAHDPDVVYEMVNIFPWLLSQPATRQDLVRLFNSITNVNPWSCAEPSDRAFAIFLDEIPWEDGDNSMIQVMSKNTYPHLVMRLDLRECLAAYAKVHTAEGDTDKDLWKDAEQNGVVEYMLDPDCPFPSSGDYW